MQRGISSWEALRPFAQCGLVALAALHQPAVGVAIRLQAEGDNAAAEAAIGKLWSNAPPLCQALMAIAKWAERGPIDIEVSHVAGTDNEWADALSRGEERVQDVLRMARALGWTPNRLYPQRSWRDLSGLPRLDA